MPQVALTLHEVGYEFMLMPDHVPGHPDDPQGLQAFAFAYGYIAGILQLSRPWPEPEKDGNGHAHHMGIRCELQQLDSQWITFLLILNRLGSLVGGAWPTTSASNNPSRTKDGRYRSRFRSFRLDRR